VRLVIGFAVGHAVLDLHLITLKAAQTFHMDVAEAFLGTRKLSSGMASTATGRVGRVPLVQDVPRPRTGHLRAGDDHASAADW